MNNEQLYNLGRVAAICVAVATTMITAAIGLPDLGLNKQWAAFLVVVVAGLQTLAVFLPAVNKKPHTVRGGEHARG